MRAVRWMIAGASTLALAGALVVSAQSQSSQQMLQQGFEGRDPIWLPGPSNVAYKETGHRLTDDTAHNGAKSEFVQFEAEKGSFEADKNFIYYTYPIGRAPVVDELNVAVWIKANRPGMKVLCRVVLPRERDPKNPEQPLTLVLEGDAYNLAGRWQQVTVRQPVKRLREQQGLLTKELNRPIVIADAYVDRVLLNVYAGPGETKIWTDDLEVGPLLPDHASAPDTTGPGKEITGRPALNQRASEVTLNGKQLSVNNERFFMRAIRHTGTPLKTLRQAGFNVVWLDESTPAALIEDAANLGFWIVPSIATPNVSAPGGPVAAQLASASEAFTRKLDPFTRSNAILAYSCGSNLPQESFSLVSNSEKFFRRADPMRPIAIDVMDGLNTYSHDPNVMLGMHRWPLMTGLEMTSYRDWLTQRRRLAKTDPYCWTWIQTHLDDWYTELIYDRPGAGGFNEPVGPQAEQIRLMTYAAVGSGYRGVGFWSDRFLADSHVGRDRLLSMAILNQELQLLEPMLVASGVPTWIDTSRPEVKAALFRTDDRKALLVIPVWFGPGSQYVPAQGAVSELRITVPQVMGSAQAWEVSPGQVRALKTDRVVGGTTVVLREFSLTSAIVFTSDLSPTGLVVRFQEQQRRMAPDAARWAHEQAMEELAKVEKVQAELDEMNVKLPDGEQLLAKSRGFLEACAKNRRNGDYTEAYADAQRALRPLRIIMRAQWDRAVRELDTPTASPYAVSFFTLPRHWKFYQDLLKLRPSANLLTGGDFEAPMDRQPEGWLLDNPTPLDDVVTKAERVPSEAKEGKQALMLDISAKYPISTPLALERSYLAVTSPTIKLPPNTYVQISGWVKIPQKISSSVDGALFFDSAGGEPLGLRLTEATGWKKFTLYRRVPASGTINVSMVMTGIGRVFFDDVRIEPLVNASGPGQVNLNTSAKAAR